MSSSSPLNIETTDFDRAPGVDVSADQQTLIGSVLDLFKGKATLQKLALWDDNATFVDPLTIAKGRDQYQAQWYGLQKAFSKVDMQKAQVTSSGNPIKIATTTEYTLTALGAKKTINSVIEIETAAGKITKVSDNWEGGIPESSIAQAFRRLNAVSVPKMVGVPKTDAEDAKRDTPAS